MKIKLAQKSYDTGDSCKLEFLLSPPQGWQTELLVTSLKDFNQRYAALELPIVIKSDSCKVPLPDNKVFFYGDLYIEGALNYPPDYRAALSGIAFIIDENFKVEILDEGIPRYESGGVYYNGNVFIFGGYIAIGESTSTASKYNLQEKSWKTVTSLPISITQSSCIEYMGFILIGGFSISNRVFAYDIAGDSYSEFLSGVRGTKIICKYDGYAYLINPERNVYESEYNNPFVWKVINKCEINKRFCDLVSFQMVFEDFFYFIEFDSEEYYYYRFDLVNKEIDNNWS